MKGLNEWMSCQRCFQEPNHWRELKRMVCLISIGSRQILNSRSDKEKTPKKLSWDNKSVTVTKIQRNATFQLQRNATFQLQRNGFTGRSAVEVNSEINGWLLFPKVVVKTAIMVIFSLLFCRERTELLERACRMCSTLIFLVQPIKFLICGIVVALDDVDAKAL